MNVIEENLRNLACSRHSLNDGHKIDGTRRTVRSKFHFPGAIFMELPLHGRTKLGRGCPLDVETTRPDQEQQLHVLLAAQLPQNLADLASDASVKPLPPVFWNDHYVVLAVLLHMGLAPPVFHSVLQDPSGPSSRRTVFAESSQERQSLFNSHRRSRWLIYELGGVRRICTPTGERLAKRLHREDFAWQHHHDMYRHTEL